MGTAADRRLRRSLPRVDDEVKRDKVKKARARIYEGNYAVDNDEVENLLKDQSLTPTAVGRSSITLTLIDRLNPQNAFSELLGPLGFNIFKALVGDFMHEWELGAWRTLFLHLLRILEAHDKNLIHELDRRYVLSYSLAFKLH